VGLILRDLSPNPIQRDQPAQRLWFNGCGSTVAVQWLCLIKTGWGEIGIDNWDSICQKALWKI
jgi:hypothetical protein